MLYSKAVHLGFTFSFYLESRTLSRVSGPAAPPRALLGVRCLLAVLVTAGAPGVVVGRMVGASSWAKTSCPRHDMLDCSRLLDLSDSQ